jgi:hypothetical protein
MEANNIIFDKTTFPNSSTRGVTAGNLGAAKFLGKSTLKIHPYLSNHFEFWKSIQRNQFGPFCTKPMSWIFEIYLHLPRNHIGSWLSETVY